MAFETNVPHMDFEKVVSAGHEFLNQWLDGLQDCLRVTCVRGQIREWNGPLRRSKLARGANDQEHTISQFSQTRRSNVRRSLPVYHNTQTISEPVSAFVPYPDSCTPANGVAIQSPLRRVRVPSRRGLKQVALPRQISVDPILTPNQRAPE